MSGTFADADTVVRTNDRADSGTLYTSGTWYANMYYLTYNPSSGSLVVDTNTMEDIISDMEANYTTPSTSTAPTSAAAISAAADWIAKLQLVYGASGATAGPADNDGDGSGSTDSEEYKLDQTGSTGADDFIVAARAQVVALHAFVETQYANTPMNTSANCSDAACVSEIVATANTNTGDGFEGAYTSLADSNSYTGGMKTDTTGITIGSAITWGSPNPVYDAGDDYTLTWGVGLTPSEVGPAATYLNANSMCAAVCSALHPWNLVSSTNLPDDPASMGTTACTGFEITVAGSAGTEPACKLSYGAIPEIATGLGSASSTVASFSRKWSEQANAYRNAMTNTVAGTDTPWDYFDAGMTNWDTAYKNLIDARAKLDLAIQYNTDIGTERTASSTGWTDLYNTFDSTSGSPVLDGGKLYDYN